MGVRFLAITFGARVYGWQRACPDFPSQHVLDAFIFKHLDPLTVSTTFKSVEFDYVNRWRFQCGSFFFSTVGDKKLHGFYAISIF